MTENEVEGMSDENFYIIKIRIMRKITQEAVLSFNQNRSFSKSNTVVSYDFMYVWNESFETTEMKLHWNVIAVKNNGKITFTLAGWPTPTTWARLKGIGVEVRQKNGTQYLVLNTPKVGVSESGNRTTQYSIEIDPNKWYDTEGNEVQA